MENQNEKKIIRSVLKPTIGFLNVFMWIYIIFTILTGIIGSFSSGTIYPIIISLLLSLVIYYVMQLFTINLIKSIGYIECAAKAILDEKNITADI